jgi:hypothetical protein
MQSRIAQRFHFMPQLFTIAFELRDAFLSFISRIAGDIYSEECPVFASEDPSQSSRSGLHTWVPVKFFDGSCGCGVWGLLPDFDIGARWSDVSPVNPKAEMQARYALTILSRMAPTYLPFCGEGFWSTSTELPSVLSVQAILPLSSSPCYLRHGTQRQNPPDGAASARRASGFCAFRI